MPRATTIALTAASALALVLALRVGGGGAGSAVATTPAAAALDPRTDGTARDTAVLAGGCFWGMEAVFEHVKGVTSVVSGYAGGTTSNPTYETAGEDGSAESVQIVFDPSQVSYGQLLRVFFGVAHDPTQLDRQGPDRGPQYRSEIFWRSDAQRRVAEAYVAQLTTAKTFAKPIVTRLEPLRRFTPAEDYHQDYAVHHPTQPYIVINDAPKVDHLRTRLPELWRDERAP